MEGEMGFASCKMAEKWFSIEDLIKCERGSWIFTPCVQEHLFARQALCLFFFTLGVFSGDPLHSLSTVLLFQAGGTGLVFVLTCFGLTWWGLGKGGFQMVVWGWLPGWLHHNHLGCLLVINFSVHCIEIRVIRPRRGSGNPYFEGIPWWFWRKLGITVNKLANRTQKTNSTGLLRISFG